MFPNDILSFIPLSVEETVSYLSVPAPFNKPHLHSLLQKGEISCTYTFLKALGDHAAEKGDALLLTGIKLQQ